MSSISRRLFTMTIDAELHQRLKEHAVQTQSGMGQIVEDCLRDYLGMEAEIEAKGIRCAQDHNHEQ